LVGSGVGVSVGNGVKVGVVGGEVAVTTICSGGPVAQAVRRKTKLRKINFFMIRTPLS
jgi:hypothetical protein